MFISAKTFLDMISVLTNSAADPIGERGLGKSITSFLLFEMNNSIENWSWLLISIRNISYEITRNFFPVFLRGEDSEESAVKMKSFSSTFKARSIQ